MYAFGCDKPDTLSELERREACHRQWRGGRLCFRGLSTPLVRIKSAAVSHFQELRIANNGIM